MTEVKLDPITLEMFWRRLNSAVDELAATLKHLLFHCRPGRQRLCHRYFRSGRAVAGAIAGFDAGTVRAIGHMLRCMLEANPPESLIKGDALIGINPLGWERASQRYYGDHTRLL